MQAQKEAPSDMQCKDKFLLQSVVVPDGTTTKGITSEMVGWLLCFFYHLFLFKDRGLCFLDVELRMEYFVLQFNKEGDKVVEEFKLRVVYIPANPPSPVPEESDEGSSPPRPSVLENGNQDSSLLDAVSISFFFSSFEIFFPPFAFSVCKCAYLCSGSYDIFNLFVVVF